MENDEINLNLKNLSEKITLLEKRVAGLEFELSQQKTAIAENVTNRTSAPSGETANSRVISDASIESTVVEYGFSWFGSTILIVGLAFLISFLQNEFNGLVSALSGATFITGVYLLANYLKKSFSYLSFMLQISSHILLYYLIIRLYFFTSSPLIPVKWIVVILLLGVSAFNIFQAIKRNSEFMAIFGLIFLLISEIITDQAHLSPGIAVLSSGLSLFLFIRQKWSVQLVFNLSIVYLFFIIWMFGNALMGHSFVARTVPEYEIIYLFICGLVFSSISLIPKKSGYKPDIFASEPVVNAIAFSLVVLMMVAAFYSTNYSLLFLLISAMCLAYSVALKLKNESLFIQSFYACLAFMALSASVYGYYKFPDAYFWLVIQSLLVVSIALWYRSRLIILMNTGLYVVILLSYFATAESIDYVNFTFAGVSLISARIINWKKARLTLETEFIRNIYLFWLFVIVLYAFYKAVPKEYISISWTLAALAYFLFSIILKNVKYRYLSISTLISSGLVLFTINTPKMTAGFLVISLLLIALIAFGIALYYVKKIKNRADEGETNTRG